MSIGRLIPLCWWCKHLNLIYDDQLLSNCHAFPDGMPEEIPGNPADGPSFDHREAHPNDQGIRFEKADLEELQRRFPFTARHLSSESIEMLLMELLRYLTEGRERGYINPPLNDPIANDKA